MKIELEEYKFSKGFGKCLNKTALDKNLTPLAFRLYFIISTCNPDEFKPSVSLLALMLDVSTATLDLAISNLKKYGYLESYGIKNNTVWKVKYKPMNLTGKVKMNLTNEP